jgi:signal transduction histidine kinase
MYWTSKTIQARLSKLLSIAIAIAAVNAVIIWRASIEPALRVALAEKQQEIANRASQKISSFLDQKMAELRAAIEVGALWEEKTPAQKRHLENLFQTSPEFLALSLIDARGEPQFILSREPEDLERDISSFRSSLVFTEAKQGRIHVSTVLNSQAGEPFVSIGVPIQPSLSEFGGALVAKITLKSLWDYVSNIQVGKSGQVYVVSQAGLLIAHRDYYKVVRNPNLVHLETIADFLARKAPRLGEIRIGEEGKRALISLAEIPTTGWAVVVEEPIDTALAPVTRVEWLAGALLLAAIVGGFMLSHRFSVRLARPIRQLEDGTQLISRGDLDHKIEIGTGDEIQSLAENFNRMAKALKDSHDELEEKITERTKEIAALYTAFAPLKPAKTLKEMLEGLLDRLIDASGADAALFRLKNREGAFFDCSVARGFDADYLELARTLAAGSSVESVMTKGIAIIAPDIATDFRFNHKLQTTAGFRSWGLLPLIVGGETRGIIELASRTPGHFKTQKRDHLTAIARQASIAIENHELFAETERHRRESDALYTITNAVRGSLDISSLTETALLSTLEVLGLDGGRLYLLGEADSMLHLAAHYGLQLVDISTIKTYRPGEGPVGRIFCQGEPAIFGNIEANSEYLELVSCAEKGLGNFMSQISLPIIVKDRSIGVLCLYGKSVREFAVSDSAFALSIGAQIGAAVETAWLHEKTQRNLERIRALRDIDKLIVNSMDLKAVLEFLLGKVHFFLPYEGGACSIRLFNKSTGALEPVACRNLDGDEWSRSLNIGDHGVANIVAESRAPLTVLNLQNDSRTANPGFFRRNGLYSYLGVPLVAQDELLGVLSYYSREVRSFLPQEIEFLATLAGQGAIAIRNSQLYNESMKKAAELERSNKVKDEFLCVMSHELRTPLSNIMGYSSLLEDEAFGKNAGDRTKAARVIRKNCGDLLALVRNILDTTKLQSGTSSVSFEMVNITALFEELKLDYLVAGNREVTLQWNCGVDVPAVYTDAAKLKQILQNLINNALKFTDEGSVIVSARYLSGQQTVEFTVADTGIGIPEDVLPFIFEKFRQVDSTDTRSYEGVGLGLFIVRGFARLLGGNIQVKSEPGRGSIFFVTLPYERSSDGVCARTIDSRVDL